MIRRKVVAEQRRLDVETPVGVIALIGTATLLERVYLPGENAIEKLTPALGDDEDFPALREARIWLKAYFAGSKEIWRMGSLPGLSPFTQRVYSSLLQVPAGKTVSYGELAALAGSPKGARAVGAAMAKNPLPIFIPCHRVIGSDGGLCGFGGGLPLKKRLLSFEGAL